MQLDLEKREEMAALQEHRVATIGPIAHFLTNLAVARRSSISCGLWMDGVVYTERNRHATCSETATSLILVRTKS